VRQQTTTELEATMSRITIGSGRSGSGSSKGGALRLEEIRVRRWKFDRHNLTVVRQTVARTGVVVLKNDGTS
jgi:hypothetical protein